MTTDPPEWLDDEPMPDDSDAPGVLLKFDAKKRRKGGKNQKESAPARAGDWTDRLTRDERTNTPKSTFANALTVLTHDPAWAGVLGYDVRMDTPMVLAKPPYRDAPESVLAHPRALDDDDDARVVQWLEQAHGITIGLTQASAALSAASRGYTYDRVREYLDGLVWDGFPRLDEWLHDYLGAPSDPYTRAVGSKWMISGVARTYRPGCKVHHVLTLEGVQGKGKSTALQILAGADYFGEDCPDVTGKDAKQFLGGLWIVDFGELAGLSKAEDNAIKSFVTNETDRYRPSYGRRTVVRPRRCVFSGSTNEKEYLTDPTGNRRWWPVATGTIDYDGLSVVRDQLWAEAVVRYRAGERWHLEDAELIELAKAEQAKRVQSDPWDDAVQTYLEYPGRTFVKSSEILTDALKLDIGKLTKNCERRVASILRRFGWVQKSTNGRRGWARTA